MSILSQVTKGKIKNPVCILLYAPDGVGKSSFAAGAPNPIFFGPERGTDNLDVTRLPTPKKFGDIFEVIDELKHGKHDYKTLVIDSLDWLEPLLHREICAEYNCKSIEQACGGYGKGYIEAQIRWIKLKDALEELRQIRKMNLILIAHSEIVTFADPQQQASYQRYELKLHKKASALWREYVDAVLFANFEAFVKTDSNSVKIFGDGARVIYTERRPAFDAKNRYGLPLKIDLSWETLAEEIEKGNPDSVESIHNRIEGLLVLVTDLELREKVVDTVFKAGDNVAMLQRIQNRLNVIIEQQRENV